MQGGRLAPGFVLLRWQNSRVGNILGKEQRQTEGRSGDDTYPAVHGRQLTYAGFKGRLVSRRPRANKQVKKT